MTPNRKLTLCAALFAVTLLLVAVAAATHAAAPLFVAWIPLVGVPWVLTRPGPEWEAPRGEPATAADAPAATRDDLIPPNETAT